MAYFPNGTAGDIYEGRYCARCAHSAVADGGCPVMLLHLLHNYDEDKQPLLNILIPEKEGEPQECTMFWDRNLIGGSKDFAETVTIIASDGSAGSPQARLNKIRQVCALVGKTAAKASA